MKEIAIEQSKTDSRSISHQSDMLQNDFDYSGKHKSYPHMETEESLMISTYESSKPNRLIFFQQDNALQIESGDAADK